MRLRVYSILVMVMMGLVGRAEKPLNTITGWVADAATKEPIADAQIFVQEISGVFTTDNKGKFEIPRLKDGFYTLTIFAYQYETLKERITINSDISLNFELGQLVQELSEVVINQQKEEAFNLKRLNPVEGTAIYAGKKTEVILLENMMGNMATNNARQVYAQIAGLNIYESNDGGLQLSIGGRGLDPSRTSNFNTRQNGYDISADVLGYPESYYTPPVEGLEEIEVIRGAASLQYGTQFGGLINFKMKKPVQDKKISGVTRHTLGSYGLYTTFNSLSGTVGKLSYYTYYNYKTGDGYRENSDFDSHNYYGYLQYAFSDKTKLSFEFTYLDYLAQQAGGLWDAQFRENPRYNSDEPNAPGIRRRNWFGVNWKLYAAKLEHKLSPKTDMSLVVFGLDAERNAVGFRGVPGADGLNRSPVEDPDFIENGEYVYPRDLIKGAFKNIGGEARVLTRYSIGRKSSVLLLGSKVYFSNNTTQQGAGSDGTGGDFNFATTQELIDVPYPNQSSFNFPNRNVAFFGENIFNLSETFSITPGFRFEYIHTKARGSYWDDLRGEMSTDNQSLPRSFLLLGIGLSKELGGSTELYANVSQNYRSVTFSDIRTVSPTFIIDENIDDENGYTADIGLRGKLKGYFSYELSSYMMFYSDRIGIVLDDRARRTRTNIGDALITGVDLFVDWNLANTLGINSLDYKISVFNNLSFTGSEYVNAKTGNDGVQGKRVEFVPVVNLKSGVNIGYKNIKLSGQLTYISEQYTDAQNSPIAVEGDARSGIIGEIPAYHVIDVSASYGFKFLKLESGVNNLTDHSYFTRRATGYPGPGIIPSDGRSFYVTLQAKF